LIGFPWDRGHLGRITDAIRLAQGEPVNVLICSREAGKMPVVPGEEYSLN